MSAPKSQTKTVAKNGKYEVTYESNFDAAEYYLFELTRAALRDVGKFLTKAFKTEYYNHFEKHTGKAGKATKYKVWSSRNTKYPKVEIGLKTGRVEGFYAYFQEFGSSKQPKLGLLNKVANENVAEILKIESTYLSGLSDEASRLASLINDTEEYEGDADE